MNLDALIQTPDNVAHCMIVANKYDLAALALIDRVAIHRFGQNMLMNLNLDECWKVQDNITSYINSHT